jgi:hypothetical protein
MTNEEFMKDFEDFQNNWEQDNEDWFADASTIISFTESPAPKKKAKDSFKDSKMQSFTPTKEEEKKT